jgi:transposase-like protein
VGVRSYAAFPLCVSTLEEMMAERGMLVDHATRSTLGAEAAAGARHLGS